MGWLHSTDFSGWSRPESLGNILFAEWLRSAREPNKERDGSVSAHSRTKHTPIGEEMEGPDVFQVTSACDVFQGQAVLCAQITSSFLAVCAVNIDMASE